jgi:hypothetical protein
MSLQEILWFIPIASFTLAAILMRKAAPFQRTVGDLTVKEAAVAEERARQLLAREGLEFALDDAMRASAEIEDKQAPGRRKRSVACGVIDRGPIAPPFLSRKASPPMPGRYVAGVRGGVRRPRRLVFLDPIQATAVRRMRIPSV